MCAVNKVKDAGVDKTRAVRSGTVLPWHVGMPFRWKRAHRTFSGTRIVDLLYGLVVQGGAMFLAQVHFWGPFEGNLVWFLHGITYSYSTNEIYLANQIEMSVFRANQLELCFVHLIIVETVARVVGNELCWKCW